MQGKKYDRKTLLPIKAEDDSSDDDNSDSDESDEDDDGPAKDAKDKEYTFRRASARLPCLPPPAR